MPNYYYVKNGGTASGSTVDASGTNGIANTKLTGAWSGTASEYFSSVNVALATATNPPATGDIICISDTATFSTGSAILMKTATAGASPPAMVISVDNSNRENAKKATATQADTVSDMHMSDGQVGGHLVYWGVQFETNSGFTPGHSHSSWTAYNSTFRLMSSNACIRSGTNNGTNITLVDCDLYLDLTGGYPFECLNGSKIEMFGGAITAGTTFAELTGLTTGTNGGGSIRLVGVDLSLCTGSLLANIGNDVNFDDPFLLRLEGCKLRDTTPPAWVEETIVRPNVAIYATNCSNTSADAEWQIYYEDMYGSLEAVDTTDIWRQDADSSRVFDGGETISYKVITTANTGVLQPFAFDMPTSRFMQLSAASTDTIRIYFVISNATTLDDTDVWAEVTYPDGTNKQTWNFLSNQNTNPMLGIGGGTVHTTDSGSDWRNGGSALTAYNEYYMDLDTSGDAGADSVPTIRLNIAIPSVTIYFAMHVDTVAP